MSKLPDDGDPWAPNNFGAKENHQLDPDGPSNRQGVSDARPTGVQLKKAA